MQEDLTKGGEKAISKTSTAVKRRYAKKSLRQYIVTLHKVNDAKLIEILECEGNKSGYIKKVLYDYLEATMAKPKAD